MDSQPSQQRVGLTFLLEQKAGSSADSGCGWFSGWKLLVRGRGELRSAPLVSWCPELIEF